MTPALIERLGLYARLVRLQRPIGIYLVLWPTLWGLWIASQGRPDPVILVVFVLGTVLMRSAGCAINDYADRHIDGHVARTRDRPLASGQVSPREAVAVFGVLSLIAFAMVLLLNPFTIQLSVVGVFLAASYPFTKRITHLPQAYLGMAFGWGIPMAFAAQTGSVPAAAWVLFVANIFWSLVYDTMYAMADRADDMKIGVKSSAILFGRYDRAIIAMLQFLVLALLVFTGLSFALGAFYFAGLAVAAVLAAYEQWMIRERDPRRSFEAFLHNHYFGLAVFAGIALDYLLGGA
jgi:4-hydroxybenzoate polyprenyltransferase